MSETLSEFLNNDENQEITLEKIIEALRARGEWGRHGLFTQIGAFAGFSSSYVGKVLKGGQPLRENFVLKMADYLNVHPSWLQGEFTYGYETARKMYQELWLSTAPIEEKLKFVESEKKKLEDETVKYLGLLMAFETIPFTEKEDAIRVLQERFYLEKELFKRGVKELSEGE